MKTRLLIIIGVIVIGIITVLGIMFIFNFDYSPTMPIVESQLQMVIDYCNDTSEVKNAILYYHSNETHSIDNIDCEWKLHQNYPNSEYICITYFDKFFKDEECRNKNHIFYNYSVALRIISGYWQNLNPHLGQAAQMLGASRWHALHLW